MDARETLRRYLEQRRDMGESELVLDALTVDDAMKLLGAANVAPRAPLHPSSGPAKAAVRPVVEEAGGDWRAVIRAAGGEPAKSPSMAAVSGAATAASGQVEPPVSPPGEAPVVALEDVPVGLIVGGANRGSLEDGVGNLQSLEAIAAAVATCTRCQLYLTATNPVPGAGSPTADFMIVGEAPGANEDEQGVPFVGQAGQLLTKIIGAIGLTRDDVFIANVLKHRPPGNRNPTPEEVAACSPYLVRQIELVKPKVILALGTFAAQTLLETKLTIGKLRGQIHRYHGVPLVVTYHPAALLRNPAWKRPTWEDVQLARRILDRAVADRA